MYIHIYSLRTYIYLMDYIYIICNIYKNIHILYILHMWYIFVVFVLATKWKGKMVVPCWWAVVSISLIPDFASSKGPAARVVHLASLYVTTPPWGSNLVLWIWKGKCSPVPSWSSFPGREPTCGKHRWSQVFQEPTLPCGEPTPAHPGLCLGG